MLQEVTFVIGFGAVLDIQIIKLICHEPGLSIVGDGYIVGMWETDIFDIYFIVCLYDTVLWRIYKLA